MTFTALHRALGLQPGPLTTELIDQAVASDVAETTDLDWKAKLPPAKDLNTTDFPKDVAAMANSGGGIIVYGVQESEKKATGRVDTGELTEGHQRALHSVAATAISPPIFGLKIHCLGSEGDRAVVVEVPASVDGPHLIYKNDLFGAPMRNDADTVWMRERQIEAMYRARFDERRHAFEALDRLYADASVGRNDGSVAWLVAVARPVVVPGTATRSERNAAYLIMENARNLARVIGNAIPFHPIDDLWRNGVRTGLRRWVFAPAGTVADWVESWASIHNDGSVTLATKVGGHHTVATQAVLAGWELTVVGIESAITDFMAMVRATAQARGTTEYDVRVGINWTGTEPMIIRPGEGAGRYGGELPIHRFTPVEMTVNASEPDIDFHWHVHDLARDCANQGGIPDLALIRPPQRS